MNPVLIHITKFLTDLHHVKVADTVLRCCACPSPLPKSSPENLLKARSVTSEGRISIIKNYRRGQLCND